VCTIVFAWRCHPRYSLLLASNRDEFHSRPTAPADWWAGHSEILGGRDLEGGGSWLAVDRRGRLAALTNYRKLDPSDADRRSRGLLVRDYLEGEDDAAAFAGTVHRGGADHAGFNLLLMDPDRVCYVSNRAPGVRDLPPGVYGLSNHLLDTPWPKVLLGKARLEALLGRPEIGPDDLLEVLNDRTVPDDDRLPDTGIGLEKERLLGACFIVSRDYGTRAATAVTVETDRTIRFTERTFDPAGRCVGERTFPLESGA
jgi:uncharacterized protein with NRDE domain